jgi:RimJ/RimL family protein N-acetyltransferase
MLDGMAGEPLELPAGGLDDGVVAVRPYRADDAALLLAGAQDPEVRRFANVSWANLGEDELRERIATTWPKLAYEGRSLNCSIRDSVTDELLGHFVLFGVDRASSRCEIGFWLRPEVRGRRVAARTCELACRWAFGEGFARVQATAMVDNIASQRTLEHAGFGREGVLRSYFPTPDGGRSDSVMYSRLAED